MVYSRLTALKRAKASTKYPVGMCQKWTREMFGALSVGDRDGDGDADAMDGWLSEPSSARHPGDRKPPVGVPLAFSGGSKGHGHRAISADANGLTRGIDMQNGRYKAGTVGYASIEQIEKQMGLKYLGWTETISGVKIPDDTKPKPPPVKKTSRGARVDRAIKETKQALRPVIQAAKETKVPKRKAMLEASVKKGEAFLASLEKFPFIK